MTTTTATLMAALGAVSSLTSEATKRLISTRMRMEAMMGRTRRRVQRMTKMMMRTTEMTRARMPTKMRKRVRRWSPR